MYYYARLSINRQRAHLSSSRLQRGQRICVEEMQGMQGALSRASEALGDAIHEEPSPPAMTSNAASVDIDSAGKWPWR